MGKALSRHLERIFGGGCEMNDSAKVAILLPLTRQMCLRSGYITKFGSPHWTLFATFPLMQLHKCSLQAGQHVLEISVRLASYAWDCLCSSLFVEFCDTLVRVLPCCVVSCPRVMSLTLIIRILSTCCFASFVHFEVRLSGLFRLYGQVHQVGCLW